MKIPTEYTGTWKVTCANNGDLHVQKIDIEGKRTSFIFVVGDDSFNDNWFNNPSNGLITIEKEIFNSIQWPSYLQPGESAIITVLPSGNYVIEND